MSGAMAGTPMAAAQAAAAAAAVNLLSSSGAADPAALANALPLLAGASGNAGWGGGSTGGLMLQGTPNALGQWTTPSAMGGQGGGNQMVGGGGQNGEGRVQQHGKALSPSSMPGTLQNQVKRSLASFPAGGEERGRMDGGGATGSVGRVGQGNTDIVEMEGMVREGGDGMGDVDSMAVGTKRGVEEDDEGGMMMEDGGVKR